MTFTRSATSSFLRIRVAAGLASGLGFLFAVVLFLTALFSHNRLFGTAALVALAASQVGLAVTWGSRTYLLFETGSWTTLGGRSTSRSEAPGRFVIWVTLHGLFVAIYSALAAFVLWVAIDHGR